MGVATSWVSKCHPFGNSGRIGRSIIRAVSVAFSPERPSRRKNEPGILPAAYIRSSTSTVRGRKSTSRRLPIVAVQRTIVSPLRTTTDPLACLASLPVSNEISLSPISAETRLTSNMLICLCVPSTARLAAYRFKNCRSLSSAMLQRDRLSVAKPGGRAAHPGADAGFEVTADPGRHLVRAAVGVEAIKVERQGLDSL